MACAAAHSEDRRWKDDGCTPTGPDPENREEPKFHSNRGKINRKGTALLIQYLLSRSSKAGGQTFEGRLTLRDLFHRLRGGGYLRTMGITARKPSEALEQLVEIYGGERRVKFYYIVDRRDLLARLASLKGARLPRPRQ